MVRTVSNSMLGSIVLAIAASNLGFAADFKGDVSDVRIVRHVEQRPGAALLWEPYIATSAPSGTAAPRTAPERTSASAS